MLVRDIQRSELRSFLDGPKLRHGKMLQISYSRRTDKKVRNPVTKKMEIVEPKGTLVERRVILRSKDGWKKATPSGSFTPKGGFMFNCKCQADVNRIIVERNLYLFLTLEGVTHPYGEKDHPSCISLDDTCQIKDTHEDICYRVLD